MAFTYDLTTDLGKLRLLLGDTTSGSGIRPDGSNFLDAELTYFLSVEGLVGAAGALACETLATQYATLANLVVGARREDLGAIGKAFADRGAALRSQYGQGLHLFNAWFAPSADIEAEPAVGVAANPVAVTPGDQLAVRAGALLSLAFSGLGSLANRSKLYFTAKINQTDADSAAQIQIEESAGLKYIAGGASGTAGNGVLTVTDAANGLLTLTLTGTETVKLSIGFMFYDLKVILTTGDAVTLAAGPLEALPTATGATA
ncbi:MAG: hypothetical protein WCF84_02280 [Anaerolineae bacterium]